MRLPDNDEALLRVDALRVGSWVEIQEDAEHKLRCKLAAVIRPTGRYIFVNRTGMKVLERTRMGLAVEFRRQAVRLLDDALLFDRAPGVGDRQPAAPQGALAVLEDSGGCRLFSFCG